MNVSNVTILRGEKKIPVHPLALAYSNFQTRLEAETTQAMG